MKNRVLAAVAVLFVMNTAFKPTANTAPEVLTAFNATFKTVEDVEWSEKGNTYSAYFVKDNVYTSITYDKNGKVLHSRRAFSEAYLPLDIVTRVKEKYPNKEIHLAVEIIEGDEKLYSIIIQDQVTVCVLETTGSGRIKLVNKFKKQQ